MKGTAARNKCFKGNVGFIYHTPYHDSQKTFLFALSNPLLASGVPSTCEQFQIFQTTRIQAFQRNKECNKKPLHPLQCTKYILRSHKFTLFKYRRDREREMLCFRHNHQLCAFARFTYERIEFCEIYEICGCWIFERKFIIKPYLE